MAMHRTDSVRAAVVDRIAAQWIALGVSLVGKPDESLIDLEALVVMTATVGRDDPRVHDGALDWCVAHGSSINVGRLKVVAREIGEDGPELQDFAAQVAGGGGPEWPVAQGRRIPFQPRGKVHVGDLRVPGVLAWRLRSAFGVAARADILAVLTTMPGPSVTQADLARMARTSKRTVALTVHALALADVVELVPVGNEQRVRLTHNQGFRDWLGRTPPDYTDWPTRFAVAATILRLDGVIGGASPIVGAIESRALVERLGPALSRVGLPRPDTTVLGERFVAAFADWQTEVARAIAP
jgi:hypothetical protein